jgi:hypothetical protein
MIPLRESAAETLRRGRNELVVTAAKEPRGRMRVGLDVEVRR